MIIAKSNQGMTMTVHSNGPTACPDWSPMLYTV